MKGLARYPALTLAAVAVALAAVVAVWWSRPAVPVRVAVADGAAILYYNSPAAVQVANRIHVGYVRTSGVVEVASVDIDAGAVVRRVEIHDYGKPDDHAAPALWPDGEDILVATAFHSSDLFLYRVGRDGGAALVCHWPGMFSYPRFDAVDGEIRLYVRNDPDRAGNLALIRRPQDCTPEEVIYKTPQGTWLYATVPDGDRIAWSVWDREAGTHAGGFLDGEPVALAPSSYEETLMWSVAGDHMSATRFSDSFACCLVGEMVAELYRDGALAFSTPPMPSPYYPTGIVLSKAAQEAIVPTVGHGIERRDLATLAALPVCEQPAAVNARAQYVANGGGSHLWLEFAPPIAGRDYASATVSLCLVP